MLDGQTVVIENHPGAGRITDTSALVKSAPNSNTIALVPNNHVVNPSVFKNISYDSSNDITPISVIGPAGLSPEQVTRLHDAVANAFNDPAVKERLIAKAGVKVD